MIQEETEQCEQLLRNLLPPHILGSLGKLTADHSLDRKSGAGRRGRTPFAAASPPLARCCLTARAIYRGYFDASIADHQLMRGPR